MTRKRNAKHIMYTGQVFPSFIGLFLFPYVESKYHFVSYRGFALSLWEEEWGLLLALLQGNH